VFYNCCWSSPAQSLSGPSPAGLFDILLSQIRASPYLESQVPVFICPRNRVAQLYPQALGTLFVSSLDSQGYGGGIRTRRHTAPSVQSTQLWYQRTMRFLVLHVSAYCGHHQVYRAFTNTVLCLLYLCLLYLHTLGSIHTLGMCCTGTLFK
jgi:hypothetical protein